MKLNELDLNAEPRVRRRGLSTKDLRRQLKNTAFTSPNRLTYQGEGSFGSVFHAPSKGPTVVKYGLVDIDEAPNQDGYLMFADTVIRQGRGNPYLPQIYDVILWKDNSGRIGYKIKLEKLISIDEAHVSLWWAFFRRLFHVSTENEIKDVLYNSFRIPEEEAIDYAFLRVVRALLNAERGLDAVQHDKQFIQAINLVRYAREQLTRHRGHSGGYDLGPSNVMVRRTPYGIQPVITDPLA